MHTIKKINQKLRKVHIAWWLLLASVMICALACYGINAYFEYVRRDMEHAAVAPIAERIGIEPTFEALDVYVEETFIPGMSRDEVLKELDKMGAYTLTHRHPLNYSPEFEKGAWLESAHFCCQPYRIVLNIVYAHDGILIEVSRVTDSI
jgi:hypothetical protein